MCAAEASPARPDLGALRVYCSEQAHSSIDKAVLTLGLGQSSLRRIPVDEEFCMQPTALHAALEEDRRGGITPVAVVATIGTTSTTAIDPVNAMADICRDHRVWLHVDAAYAGVAAMLPECAPYFAGWERADSIVINPHKWLFTPFDLSAFYCRRMEVVREAFSLVPEYLKTTEASIGARNLMDTGIQLGRRFRSLKLWMILRHFGAARLRSILAEHIRLAHEFAEWVDNDPDFERLAPVPFAVVCFRANPAALRLGPAELDLFNERLLDAVNGTGEVFLSHTRINGAFVIRIAIGHLRTTASHTRPRVGAALTAYGRARGSVGPRNSRQTPILSAVCFAALRRPRAFRLHPRCGSEPSQQERRHGPVGGTQMLKKCALIAAVLLVIGPASARADWLFTPNIGVGFGGDTPQNDKLTYGATLGWMGAGIVGFEADWSYTPTFFENSTDNISFADSDNVQNLMANVDTRHSDRRPAGPRLPAVCQRRDGADENARRRRRTAVHSRQQRLGHEPRLRCDGLHDRPRRLPRRPALLPRSPGYGTSRRGLHARDRQVRLLARDRGSHVPLVNRSGRSDRSERSTF